MYLEQQLEELKNMLNNLEKQIINYNLVSSDLKNKSNEANTLEYIIDQDMLYTVKEVSKILKTNPAYVYSLIRAGLLPVLKLGSYKIRRVSLIEFLKKYEGQDLTDVNNIKPIEL